MFPVKPSQIPDFEKKNDISIDVCTASDKNISPVYKTVRKKLKHVDSLLIQSLNNFYYVWIKSLLWLLKGLTILPKIFPVNAEIAQSKNGLKITDEVRDIILQKAKILKTAESVQTSRQIFDQEYNFSADISAQTNSENKANDTEHQ